MASTPPTKKHKPMESAKAITVTPAEGVEVLTPKPNYTFYDIAMQKEEQHLSDVLFGGNRVLLKSFSEETHEVAAPIDVSTDEADDNRRTAAWLDADEEIAVGQALDKQRRQLPNGGINSRVGSYKRLLQEKYNAVVGTPKWADLDKKPAEVDSDEEVLQVAGKLTTTKPSKLIAGTLEFKKLLNLNCQSAYEGAHINSVEFHPAATVALVAGQSGIATLYSVDGKRNYKIHSVEFEKFPILCAKFNNNGNEGILGSRKSYMYCYDMCAAKGIKIPLPFGVTQMKNFVMSPDGQFIAVAGKFGEVHLLSATTKEKICTLKQNHEVTALCFNSDGSMLVGHSDDSEVTIWDVSSRRMRHTFTDEGCLQGTTLDISSSHQFIATGSAEGVVNVYDMEAVLQQKTPTPRKCLKNLTTAIKVVKFNPTAECLAFGSSDLENSVRMFHLESQTVFQNFPNPVNKIGHANTLNFSPKSGYLAIGNQRDPN